MYDTNQTGSLGGGFNLWNLINNQPANLPAGFLEALKQRQAKLAQAQQTGAGGYPIQGGGVNYQGNGMGGGGGSGGGQAYAPGGIPLPHGFTTFNTPANPYARTQAPYSPVPAGASNMLGMQGGPMSPLYQYRPMQPAAQMPGFTGLLGQYYGR